MKSACPARPFFFETFTKSFIKNKRKSAGSEKFKEFLEPKFENFILPKKKPLL